MSSPAAPSFPAPRVQPNHANAFGGVLRLTLYRFASPTQWLWTIGMMLLVGLLAIVNLGDKSNFMNWTTEFYLLFFLPALVFLSGGGAMRDEMKGNTIDYILTRPIPRWMYLVFRYVAQWICTQIGFLLVLGVLVGVGFYRHLPGLSSDLPLLLLAQGLSVTVFLAFGFLCAVLTSRYVIVGLLYGAVVEIGFGRIPVQISELSMTHQLRELLHHLSTGASGSAAVTQTATVMIGVTTLMLALAAALFTTREFAGARPSEN